MDRFLVATTAPDNPGVEIRRFSDAKIGESIEKALAVVPAGKTGAVVAVADLKGVRLATMARLGQHWSVVVVTGFEWKDRRPNVEAAVRFAW